LRPATINLTGILPQYANLKKLYSNTELFLLKKGYLCKKIKTMNTSAIRQKLYEYIKVADDKKVKAIYTIIESEVNELYEWWNDRDLMAELDCRSADLKSGKDKGYPWEEVKKELLNSRKTSTRNGV